MKSVKGYNYQCQCTRDWHGDTCEHRTVHKATLTKEIEKFVKSSGGACKTDELYDYLAGNIRGRYPSYKWTVLCQVKRGRMDSYVETDSQIINYESSSHQTWILWENRNLPSSTVSRYSRGKAKAEQYLKNMDIKICYPKILMDLIRKEFKKMNLSYLMITVMRGDRREGVAFAYRGRSEMVSESGVRRAILCIEGAVFNDFHRIIHVLVIGAQEKA